MNSSRLAQRQWGRSQITRPDLVHPARLRLQGRLLVLGHLLLVSP